MSNPHLQYSILALSARQLERKEPTRGFARSMALYQQAIHVLLPQMETRSTAVIASCVVLCVLEMMSCMFPALQFRLLAKCRRCTKRMEETS